VVVPRVLAALILSTLASDTGANTMPPPLDSGTPATICAAAELGQSAALPDPDTAAAQASASTSPAISSLPEGAAVASLAAAAAPGWALMHWLTALTSVEQLSRLASSLRVALVFSSSCTLKSRLQAVRVSAMVVREEGIQASEDRTLPDCTSRGVMALTRLHWQALQLS
jgi:hypothetical protein